MPKKSRGRHAPQYTTISTSISILENLQLYTRIPARRPWLMKWWFGKPLSRVLRKWNADAFVSLEGPLATDMPADFPQLTVIHDLNFEHRPEGLPQQWRDYYQTEFPHFAKRAQVLGTVSEYSRQDLATTYGLDESAIEVFSNAADEAFQPASTEEREGARRTLSEGRPYFIFVGSLHPRKNVEGLMSAFESYRALGGSWDLVVVGVAMWSDDLPASRGLRKHPGEGPCVARLPFATDPRLPDLCCASVIWTSCG